MEAIWGAAEMRADAAWAHLTLMVSALAEEEDQQGSKVSPGNPEAGGGTEALGGLNQSR
jgi:hypothetical protein